MSKRILTGLVLIGIAVFGVIGFEYKIYATQDLAVEKLAQVEQAKELLGVKGLRKVAKIQDDMEVSDFVHSITEKSLPKKWKAMASRIADTIIEESAKYRLDPLFLMAVIRTESSFSPEVRGSSGEIGLMQLLPKTAKWIISKTNLELKGNLKDPVENIKIGAAYFSYLRDKFSANAAHYIAAYNMGTTNVYRALASNKKPKVYPMRVMKHYFDLYSTAKKEEYANY
ncbi:MAG: lytic transglycosylase domain-containing protein [Bacteriovoracia bacterium]